MAFSTPLTLGGALGNIAAPPDPAYTPINVSRPRVRTEGADVVCDPGEWDTRGGGPIRYAYQWYMDDLVIVGQTSDRYTPTRTAYYKCLVAATNDEGNDPDSDTFSNAVLFSHPNDMPIGGGSAGYSPALLAPVSGAGGGSNWRRAERLVRDQLGLQDESVYPLLHAIYVMGDDSDYRDELVLQDFSTRGTVRTPQPGRCLQFNGTSHYVDYPIPLNAGFYWRAQVKISTGTPDRIIFDARESDGVGVVVRLDGLGHVEVLHDAVQLATTAVVTDGAWYTVDVAHNGDMLRLNLYDKWGRPVEHRYAEDAKEARYATNMRLGATSFDVGGSKWFDGKMHAFQLWKEWDDASNQFLSCITCPLEVTGSGNVLAVDVCGEDNHGTLAHAFMQYGDTNLTPNAERVQQSFVNDFGGGENTGQSWWYDRARTLPVGTGHIVPVLQHDQNNLACYDDTGARVPAPWRGRAPYDATVSAPVEGPFFTPGATIDFVPNNAVPATVDPDDISWESAYIYGAGRTGDPWKWVSQPGDNERLFFAYGMDLTGFVFVAHDGDIVTVDGDYAIAGDFWPAYVVPGGEVSYNLITESGTAHWRMQDDAPDSTTVKDELGNYDGTVRGGKGTAEMSVPGPQPWIPKALAFDGLSDDVLTDAPWDYSLPWSISFWANMPWEASQCIVGASAAAGIFKASSASSLDLVVGGFTDGENAVRNIAVETFDAWHLYTVTSSGGSTPTLKLYLDGALHAERALTNAAVTNFANTYLASRNVASFSSGELADVVTSGTEFSATGVDQMLGGPEPINISPPVITDNAGTLTCTPGTWDDRDNPPGGPLSYYYQWWIVSDDENITAYSNNFVAWTSQNCAVTGGQPDPDGGNTAVEVVAETGSPIRIWVGHISMRARNKGDYKVIVHAKGDGFYVILYNSRSTDSFRYQFSLSEDETQEFATSLHIGDDWYEITMWTDGDFFEFDDRLYIYFYPGRQFPDAGETVTLYKCHVFMNDGGTYNYVETGSTAVVARQEPLTGEVSDTLAPFVSQSNYLCMVRAENLGGVDARQDTPSNLIYIETALAEE